MVQIETEHHGRDLFTSTELDVRLAAATTPVKPRTHKHTHAQCVGRFSHQISWELCLYVQDSLDFCVEMRKLGINFLVFRQPFCGRMPNIEKFNWLLANKIIIDLHAHIWNGPKVFDFGMEVSDCEQRRPPNAASKTMKRQRLTEANVVFIDGKQYWIEENWHKTCDAYLKWSISLVRILPEKKSYWAPVVPSCTT